VPDAATARSLSALDFHVSYGPPALRPEPSQTFIVPIQPVFYEGLFPDSPDLQMGLFAPRPYGNALRKAYLSHAGTRLPAPGATLLFYRSGNPQAVAAVGVLEAVKVSSDPDEILAFVGSRTVYPAAEVINMTTRGDVVAYLFRQDRFLEPPLRLAELIAKGLITAPPQSTLTVSAGGFQWLAGRLGV
jgi:hypothetical protein